MPATTTRGSKVAENEVDLLSEMDTNPTGPNQDEEDFDLLSDMSESDAKAWVPWNEDDQPRGIQGTVTHVGTVTQDAKYGGDEVPYVELTDKDGTVWGVRGYSTVLENQMNKVIDGGLRSGDIFAVVYKGETTNRKGDNTYKNFQVKTKHIGH
jgi:hypothetical protein